MAVSNAGVVASAAAKLEHKSSVYGRMKSESTSHVQLVSVGSYRCHLAMLDASSRPLIKRSSSSSSSTLLIWLCCTDGAAFTSKLNMVDLAGSERAAKTGASGTNA